MKKIFALLVSAFVIAMLAACASDDNRNAQENEDDNKVVENEETKKEVKEEVKVDLTAADKEKAKSRIGEIENQTVFTQLMVDMALQKVKIAGSQDGIPGITNESFRRIPMKSPYIEYFMEKLPAMNMDTEDHNLHLSVLKKWKENNFDEVDQDVYNIVKTMTEDPTEDVVKRTPEEEQVYIDKYLKEERKGETEAGPTPAKEKIGEIKNDQEFAMKMIDMSIQKVNIDGHTEGIKGIADKVFNHIPMEKEYMTYLKEELASIETSKEKRDLYNSILNKWQESKFNGVDQDVKSILKSLSEDATDDVVKKSDEEEQEYIDKYLKE